MRKLFLAFLVILSLLTGCMLDSQELPIESVPDEPSDISAPATDLPTSPPTYPPTEPTPVFEYAPGMYFETYTDENTLDYFDFYLFLPENADFNMPLVVFLHGDGEVRYPKNLENYGPVMAAREIYGDAYPFIALYPCTRVFSWVDEPIPETLMGLIDEIALRLASDPDHIILTGHSRGSSGVWNMLSLYGDYFSAAVPISCGPSTKVDYEMIARVPIRAVVGTVGEYEINYGKAMRNTVNKLIDFGADAELIYLWDHGHGATSHGAFTEEMFEWMLTQ